jgi:hypothetical protein
MGRGRRLIEIWEQLFERESRRLTRFTTCDWGVYVDIKDVDHVPFPFCMFAFPMPQSFTVQARLGSSRLRWLCSSGQKFEFLLSVNLLVHVDHDYKISE